jgi:hypothetical protein
MVFWPKVAHRKGIEKDIEAANNTSKCTTSLPAILLKFVARRVTSYADRPAAFRTRVPICVCRRGGRLAFRRHCL